jgi:hypothetical protein
MADKEQDGTGKWLTRTVTGAAVKAVVQHAMVTYVIPLGIPLVTGYLAYLQGLPWAYIITCTALTLAGLTHFMVKFDDLQERRRVKDKITFRDILVGRGFPGNGIVLGVILNNRAKIPVECELREMRTRAKNMVPVRKVQPPPLKMLAPADGTAVFHDMAIDIGDWIKPGTAFDGAVEATLRYGRPGAKKYDLTIRKGVTISIDDQGGVSRVPYDLY